MSESRELIFKELDNILSSRQFLSAPTMQAFLSFVVKEASTGRSGKMKAYTIATEALRRSPEFDPSTDTIVRTTAGRVRKALEAYYRESDTDSCVVISLPKGGYIPVFDIIEKSSQSPSSVLPQPPRRLPTLRPQIWAVICLCMLIGMASASIWWLKVKEVPQPVTLSLNVLPTEYTDQSVQVLAKSIDLRLAPALSQIGLADIYPSDSMPSLRDEGNRSLSFTLRTSISHTEDSSWRWYWQLLDAASNRLLWAANEEFSAATPTAIDNLVSKVSFQVLGEHGAVASSLQGVYGSQFSNQTCIVRAHIIRTIENDEVYSRIRQCLEDAARIFPNDASLWASLSSLYTVRTRYYRAGMHEEYSELIQLASHAAEKAEALAPDAYLTKVARMQLALRQGKINEFDSLQQQIRSAYPGDIYLKLRIASRIARLGRGAEALSIYNEASEDWHLNLGLNAADIALAYFVESSYEEAYWQIMRATSDQLFVVTLKASILGKLGMTERARPVVQQLLTLNPDIRNTFYPWFTELSWAPAVLAEVADGLAKAGLVVSLDEETWR